MLLSQIIKILLFGYPISEEFIDSSFPIFLQNKGGLLLTIIITVFSTIFGLLLGIMLSLIYNQLQIHCKTFKLLYLLKFSLYYLIEIFKSIPIVILVLLFYFLPYPLFNIRIPAIILAIFAFSIYGGIYSFDIINSGFNPISKEINNVAKTIGLSNIHFFIYIKLPIAIKVMLPAILGLIITIFKDTSVLLVVGVAELTFTSRQLSVSSPGRYASILFLVILIYMSFATLLSIYVQKLETNNQIYGWGGSV